MEQKKIPYSSINFGNDAGREFFCIPLIEMCYGCPQIAVYYLPRSVVPMLRLPNLPSDLSERNFLVYREIGAIVMLQGNQRRIAEFVVEEVVHPVQRAAVAEAYHKAIHEPREQGFY